MVSVLAYYSYETSSNPVGCYNFIYEKMQNKQKEAGVGSTLKEDFVTAISFHALLPVSI